MKVSFSDIKQAEHRLDSLVKKTPVSRSKYFSQKLGLNLFLKWETEQKIKSFKIRGALNKILSLTDKERKQGLIAVSAGNHAQGVAFAANHCKTKARVVMMEKASQVKVKATQKLGAEVILKGKNYDESYSYAQSIKGNSIFIHPFADSQIIAGQGTIGIEILKDLPDVHSVVLAIGGGGLLVGVSLALKTLKPSIKVYGIVWDGTADFCKKFNQDNKTCLCGKQRPTQKSKIGITDGVAVNESHPEMVKLCTPYIDDIACVSEQDIKQCIIDMKKQENKVVEGSGVIALAGLLKHHQNWNLGENCCVVVSGANIDNSTFLKIMES